MRDIAGEAWGSKPPSIQLLLLAVAFLSLFGCKLQEHIQTNPRSSQLTTDLRGGDVAQLGASISNKSIANCLVNGLAGDETRLSTNTRKQDCFLLPTSGEQESFMRTRIHFASWEYHADSKNEVQKLDLASGFESTESRSLLNKLFEDQKSFYSPESLTMLTGGLVVGAAFANSSSDRGIQKHFQSSIRGATSDEWFEALHASKELGDGVYTLPVFATAWLAKEVLPESQLVDTTGTWGEKSIRGFIVGAPPLIALQHLTGGSRPGETLEGSEWHPFKDNNGVSGHSFMGALPFITAAKMTKKPAYKLLFYAGSAVAPLSRVNDNAHYPSQVALGWWVAYLAASAIDATDNPNSRWRFYPYTMGDGSGLMAEYRF